MKTQTVFKIVITEDDRAVIHTKDYSVYQVQEIDDMIRAAMKTKKEKFFFGFINPKGELRLELAIAPKDW